MRGLVRGIAALTSAVVLTAAGQLWVLQQRVETTVVTSRAAIPAPRPTPVGTEFTALLVGLDARTDANGDPLPPDLLDALHAGPDEASCTPTRSSCCTSRPRPGSRPRRSRSPATRLWRSPATAAPTRSTRRTRAGWATPRTSCARRRHRRRPGPAGP
ncbi:hypothetical protein BJF78_31205 [Pseudonocardia sp. CNS-139]|nr:hypothetical protein BJF78_31205 [Pseudonocardia sp. CNS-139]